jgi:leucyl aminopeptidase
MFIDSSSRSIPVYSVDKAGLENWKQSAPPAWRDWVEASGFKAGAGSHLMVPDEHGGIGAVLAGRESTDRLWALAHLPAALPEGDYRLEVDWTDEERDRAAVGWGLGGYRFDRYKQLDRPLARLVLDGPEPERVRAFVDASCFVRDLVNTPALDLGPGELAEIAEKLANEHGADFEVIEGERLESASSLLSMWWVRLRQPRAPADPHAVGARRCAGPGPGRQGRDLRFRRTQHQGRVRAWC